MNLFYTDFDIEKTVMSLDDRRLIKQILECKVILGVAIQNKTGYAKHPVVAYYKDYPAFVSYYAVVACHEYEYRFKKQHAYLNDFLQVFMACNLLQDPIPDPIYVEGKTGCPTSIRTTNAYECVQLFREKLCNKWNTDKRAPKWTVRKKPEWYVECDTK